MRVIRRWSWRSIVGYGPFVTNSEAEIRQAVDDFNAGRFEASAAA